MAITTLEEKFMHELSDLYDAEDTFLDAQQDMLGQATSPIVQSLLQQHIAETKQQIESLEQIFQIMAQKAKRVKCEGAIGIVDEAQKLLKETSSSSGLIDLAIATSALKIEYYEIASYKGMIAGARMMGQNEVVALLLQNLAQEEQTAQKIEQNIETLQQQALSRAAVA